jgi:hypothetical protein
MEYQKMEKFLSRLKNYHILSPNQWKNVTRLNNISEKFHKRAGILRHHLKPETDRTIILESGHQPNFLPHPGTWKKAFLLNKIQQTLILRGESVIAFFGLADQNISTAKVLSKNQIPDLNKNGYRKTGFKINDAYKLKSFNKNEKPAVDNWEKEITGIEQHYRNYSKRTRFQEELLQKQWDEVLDILWRSYDQALNFADLNALIFTRVCNALFDCEVSFFLYSDMHRDCLFLDESKKILLNLSRFNNIYNREIAENHLEIPSVSLNHLPFWYECECGMKLDLSLNRNDSLGCNITCPLCKKENELFFGTDFENLGLFYNKMDFQAVSRNIIMAQGLGDTLFLSGTGGSLQYGKISDRISVDLKFHHPIILSWGSKDYYIGKVQKTAIHEMRRTLSLSPQAIYSGTLREEFLKFLAEVSRNKIEAALRKDQKEIRYWTGMEASVKNLVGFTRNMFLSTHSFIDILANYQCDEIRSLWEKAILESEIQNKEQMYRIQADICYPVKFLQGIQSSELPALYEQIQNLGIE